MRPVQDKEDEEKLKALITNHVRETGSPRGREILDNWENSILLFKKVIPADYSRMLTAIRRLEDRGASREQAELEAFYTVQKGMG